jgi:hypothetical protein
MDSWRAKGEADETAHGFTSLGRAKEDGERGITVSGLQDVTPVLSVKWTGGDDVFDGLSGGSKRAVSGQLGS